MEIIYRKDNVRGKKHKKMRKNEKNGDRKEQITIYNIRHEKENTGGKQ